MGSAPQEPLYSRTGKSIMATIRVVGRATLQQIQNNERTEPKNDDDESREKLYHDDYITAWCTELTDDNSHTSTWASSSSSSISSPAANAGVQNGKNVLDVCNELADDIEEMFDSIITLKKKQDITEAARQQQQQEQDDDDDEVSASSSSSFATAREDENKENNVFSAATLRRMKLEAELDLVDDDDDDDDDNDNDAGDDDDSIDDEGDLKKILQKAFRVAKASDTQGYTIVSSSSTIASTDTNNEEEEENKIKS